MARRTRNLVLFVAAILGMGLLVIGVTAVLSGDQSGWRGVIGAAIAFALVASVWLRARHRAGRGQS